MDSKQTVLIVDQKGSSRDVLEKALRLWGYEVCRADNGKDALQVFRITQPALVITDLFVPGMDGLKILREVKSSRAGTHVIVCSTYGSSEEAVALMKLGATDFFAKPIHYARLKSVMEKLLPGQQCRIPAVGV